MPDMSLLDLFKRKVSDRKAVERSAEERRELAERASNLALYCSPWCGYCRRVELSLSRLGLEIPIR